MPRFRLALINPNSDEHHTAMMTEGVAAVIGVDGVVLPFTAVSGPRSIETAADEAVAAVETMRLVQSASEFDAVLIACFNDPGINAVREITDAPVVGIGEAAYRASLLVARRFAVITTLSQGIADVEESMERLGVRNRCVGVLPLGIPVSEQGARFGRTTDAITVQGRRAVAELGAEALVLACGGMTDVESAVRAAVGVPATNGVSFGALLAQALWKTGLRTSASGSYASRPRDVTLETQSC